MDLFKNFFDETVSFFSKTAKNYLLSGLLLYSKFIVMLDNRKDAIFRRYPMVKLAAVKGAYYADVLMKHVNGLRVEPYSNVWTSTSSLMNDHDQIIETYHYKDTIVDEIVPDNLVAKIEIENRISKNYLKTIHENLGFLKNAINEVDETMIVVCENDKRFVITNIQSSNNFTFEYPLVKTSVKFISITYTHPNMTQNIDIELSDDYYVKGSRILSALFIKRYLEYNCAVYFFDKRYKLIIIDNNADHIELRYGQYIQFDNKRGYDVEIMGV